MGFSKSIPFFFGLKLTIFQLPILQIPR